MVVLVGMVMRMLHLMEVQHPMEVSNDYLTCYNKL